MHKGSELPTSPLTLVVWILDASHPREWEVVSHRGFALRFPGRWGSPQRLWPSVDHRKGNVSVSLCSVLNWTVWDFYSDRSSLCIRDTKILGRGSTNMLSHRWVSFQSLDSDLWCPNDSILLKPDLPTFSYAACDFPSHWRPYWMRIHGDVSLCFSHSWVSQDSSSGLGILSRAVSKAWTRDAPDNAMSLHNCLLGKAMNLKVTEFLF